MSRSIVLGLGNPGARYEETRHNLGFRVAEELSVRLKARPVPAPREAPVLDLFRSDRPRGDLLIARPATFMNRAGLAADWLIRTFGAHSSDLVVVFDDADLEIGRVRVRRRGGAGGHRGAQSVIGSLGTDEFARVRLGVRGAGRASMDLAEYVLREFDPEERGRVPDLVSLGADAVVCVVDDGIESAMNRFNQRSEAEGLRGLERERDVERTGPAEPSDPGLSEG